MPEFRDACACLCNEYLNVPGSNRFLGRNVCNITEQHFTGHVRIFLMFCAAAMLLLYTIQRTAITNVVYVLKMLPHIIS
jgi:hypothetical protein